MKKYFNFKHTLILLSLMLTLSLFGCGCGEKSGDASGGSKTEFTVVKNITVGELDQNLSAKGKQLFDTKCVACHKLDTRLVGPPLADVAKRRSAEYIVSMIMSPDKMLASNDTTKALLAKYMTSMTNQNVNQDDARAIYEYFREVSGNK